MTDAALPVTERAVEQFAEAYLSSLGADIRKDGQRWTISVPEDADTQLEMEETVVQIARDPDDVDSDTLTLAPESRLFEKIVDEAAGRIPVGSLSLTHGDFDLSVPNWITAGPVEVRGKTFTPYYDREAICYLFHIGIETVSEYQREELHAIAIDLTEREIQPRLTDTFLELTNGGDSRGAWTDGSLDQDVIEETLDQAARVVEDEVTPIIQETQQRATRAAEVELDEYRQFAKDRKGELEAELASVSERIEETNETIESATDQQERIHALQQRNELRTEMETLRSELDELTNQIEAGFPDKEREIRDRHALTARFRPVSATQVSYERGEIKYIIRMGDIEHILTYPYAVGKGVLEEQACERCDELLSEENPLTVQNGTVVGRNCCRQHTTG